MTRPVGALKHATFTIFYIFPINLYSFIGRTVVVLHVLAKKTYLKCANLTTLLENLTPH